MMKRLPCACLVVSIVLSGLACSPRPGKRPVRIMPLGDSITSGAGGCRLPQDPATCTGYRESLWNVLIANGFSVDFVGSQGGDIQKSRHFDTDHEGHGGWDSLQIARGREGYPKDGVYAWLERNPADIILLHIGTNTQHFGARGIGEILDEIDRFEAAHAAGIAVVLALIINRRNHICPAPSPTTIGNKEVRDMARRRIAQGDKIVLVDMECAAGLDYKTGMTDTLHPNPDSYLKMAKVWYAALEGLLKAIPPS